MAGLAAGLTIVLVTHHVEEIPPGFDHILMLADGRVAARGAIEQVLTAERLSKTYGVDLRLERVDGRFRAQAAPGL